jgi:hypothetical protein
MIEEEKQGKRNGENWVYVAETIPTVLSRISISILGRFKAQSSGCHLGNMQGEKNT